MGARKRPTQARAGVSGSAGWLFRAILGASSALTYYTLAVRPWLLRWGATAEEASTSLPGDELVPAPAYTTTRAVTVRAAADSIWPWLIQLGQARAGFYTYDRFEQIAGAAGACARAVSDNGPAHRSIDPARARNPVGDGLDLDVCAAADVRRSDAVAGAYACRLPAPRCPGAVSPIAVGARALRDGARHADWHQAPR
jgi:hypothetical protein